MPRAIGTQEPRETKPGCFVVIDNSNVWIEGKRVSARLHEMHVDKDNRWRLNVEALVNCVLDGRKAAKLALFGSVPPPVDSVWNKFSEVLDTIALSKRCTWSRKEKEVDMKIGMMLTTDATRLDEKHQNGDDETYLSRSYVIIGGDRDYLSVVQQILLYGMPVCVWSWKHALHSSYLQLEQGDKFEIKYLDDVFQRVGFIESAYHLEKFRVNRDCTLVILNAAKNADMIDELIMNRCCNQVGWVYACDDRLLWVLDPRSTVDDVDAVFAEARKVLPPENVFSFVEMEPKLAATADTALYSEYARYAPLDDGLSGESQSGDEEEEGEQRMSAAEEPQQGWQPVRDDKAARQQRARFDAEERRGRDPCRHREFCNFGLGCDFGHTEAERTIFKLSGLGKSPFTEKNYCLHLTPCTKHASKDDVPACPYLHRDQPRACVNCLGFYPFSGKCSRCDPVVRFKRGALRPGEAARQHFKLRTGICAEHGRMVCEECLFLAAP
jgi:hypothetical protein